MPKRIRIRSEFLTVRRCYWPRAHTLLSAIGRSYDAHATGELMRLNLDDEQRDLLEHGLPAAAVVEGRA